jgi:hypothetical protein
LPNGSFVEIDGAAYLVWDDALMLWTPERYAKKIRRPPNAVVTVLTPQPSIECFRHGYQPAAHASAQSI